MGLAEHVAGLLAARPETVRPPDMAPSLCSGKCWAAGRERIPDCITLAITCKLHKTISKWSRYLYRLQQQSQHGPSVTTWFAFSSHGLLKRSGPMSS